MYREILCGPFEKDFDGIRADGYLFSRCDDDSTPFYQKREKETWYLIEDGSFINVVEKNDDVVVFQGTFDSSKLEEYVHQIKQFKTDWIRELNYKENDEESYNDDEESYNDEELPF